MTCYSANIPAQRCEELIKKKLPNDFSKTDQLVKFLIVTLGMIYVLTVNVDVADGLKNGCTGVVKLIEYRMID